MAQIETIVHPETEALGRSLTPRKLSNPNPLTIPEDEEVEYDYPVSPPTEPMPRELRVPTHPLVTEGPHRASNTRNYLDFYGTTYKSSFLPPPTLGGPPRTAPLPASSGFNNNFPMFDKSGSFNVPNMSGGRIDTPRPPTGSRRIRTAPAADAAHVRTKLAQIKELTGYNVNFGPNIAAHLPQSYVSCHNSDFTGRGGGEDRYGTTSGRVHSVNALLYIDKPILARSWE
jgi:hypothetical protein